MAGIVALEKGTVKDGSNMETTEKVWLKVPERRSFLGCQKPEPTNLSSRVSFRPSVSGSEASG